MANKTFFNRAFGGMLASKILEPNYTGGAYSSVGNQFTKPASKFGNFLNDVLNFAVGAFSEPYSPAGLAYGVKNVTGNRAYNRQLQDQTQLALLNARQQADIARATGIQGLPDNYDISPTFDFKSVYEYAMPQQAKNNAVANYPNFMQTGQQVQQSQYNSQPQQKPRQGVYIPPQKPGDIPLIQLPLPQQNPVIPVNNMPGVLSGGVDYTQPQLFDSSVVEKAVDTGVNTVKNAYDYGEKIYSTDENNRNRLQTASLNNRSNEKIAGMNNYSREQIAKGNNNTALSMNSTNNITRLQIEEQRKNNVQRLAGLYGVLERRLENTFDENERQSIIEDMQKIQNAVNEELGSVHYNSLYPDETYYTNENINKSQKGKYIY